jgi:hypothetical protein
MALMRYMSRRMSYQLLLMVDLTSTGPSWYRSLAAFSKSQFNAYGWCLLRSENIRNIFRTRRERKSKVAFEIFIKYFMEEKCHEIVRVFYNIKE